MKVYLNQITGIDDAAVSMLMSKRSWTRDKEMELRNLVYNATTKEGFTANCSHDVMTAYMDLMDKLIKYGVGQMHTTLLRFIDLSFTVEGLHRAGQDDWDAHTKRLDNRIIRASTRLGTFKEGEVSEYYKDKIKFPFEVLEKLGIPMPDEFYEDGVTYSKVDYGYVRKDLKDIQDVKRGLYPESIPSNFIFKVQYPELCHIIQFRDNKGHAHPEVQYVAEQIKEAVYTANWNLGDNLTKLVMEPGENR
jgi:hypothetical protein